MQKKLIALAVAGLVSAPAFAQSNVQIYGIVDAAVQYGKSGDNRFSGVESGQGSGSRLGLRGTEDLGNGLKAKFVLEYALANDAGGSIGDARQQWVGLEGGFGLVGLGRQYSPGHEISNLNDVFGASSAFSTYTLIAGAAGSSMFVGGPGRFNNSINYVSNSYGGFKFHGIYQFGENADQANDLGNRNAGRRYGLGGSYSNGPVKAGIVYHNTKGTSTPDVSDTKEWLLTAGYDFGVLNLAGHYGQVKQGSDKNKFWNVNASIPVSEAGKVLVGYADLDHALAQRDASTWTVAYMHSLSKRTTAYAGYRRTSNDDASTVTAVSKLATGVGDNSNGITVGVRHAF